MTMLTRSVVFWLMLLVACNASICSVVIAEENPTTLERLSKSTKIVERSRLANLCLLELLSKTAAHDYAPSREALAEDIAALRGILGVLLDLDNRILTEIGYGATDERRISDVERYCACGWMNGWAVMGYLARRIPEVETSENIDKPASLQRQLLWLRAEEGSSVFSHLMALHQQLRNRTGRFKNELIKVHQATAALVAKSKDPERAAANLQRLTDWLKFNDTSDDPLHVRLHGAVDSTTTLGSWWHGKRPDSQSSYLIPQTRDFVGEHSQEYDHAKGLLSLWALVNLQLDTWHAGNNPTKSVTDSRLGDLARWLADISNDPRVAEVESGRLQAITRKLSQFFLFRQRATDEQWLLSLVRSIATERQSLQPKKDLKTLNGYEAFGALINSAEPLPNGEYLADAAVWLRYVMLMSYERDGGLVLVSEGPHDINKQWQLLGLPQQSFVLPLGNVRAQGLYRWQGFPPSGHSTRCLHSLCNSVLNYMTHLSGVKELESNRSSISSYGEKLSERLSDFTCRLSEHLPAEERQLGRSEASWRQSPYWLRTATEREQERILEDRAAIVARIDRSLAYQSMLLQVIEVRQNLSESRVLPLPPRSGLPSLGGSSLIAECDLSVPPTKTLKEYANEIGDLAEQLKEKVDARNVEKYLREAYQMRQYEVSIQRLEYEASVCAAKAAQHALEMAEIYDRMSGLAKQISEWQSLAREQDRLAVSDHRKANTIRLELAVRGRDLAHAQLAAAKLAYEKAPQMIEQAVQSLQQMQRQLYATADSLEEQQRRSFIVGIIKSVVRIVGVALAPFTGGASIGIAQAVTTAVDLINQIDQMNWSSLGNIVQNVGAIASQADEIVTPVLKVTGGADEWSKFKSQLNTFQSEAKGQLQSLTGEAKLFLKNLKSLDELVTAINAAAAALPVRIDQGNLVLDLNNSSINDLKLPKLEIKDRDLEQAFLSLLRSGGMFVSSLEERAAGLTDLLHLNDDELKNVVKDEFDRIVRTAPPEVLARISAIESDISGKTVEISEIEKRLSEARKTLKNLLLDNNSQASRRLLAEILGNGMVLVTTSDDRVIAVGRDISQDVAQLNERKEQLKSFASKKYDELIQSLVREIQGKQTALQGEAKAATDEQNIQKLNELAKRISEPDGEIEQVRASLDKLKDAVNKAESEFKDAQLAADAAQLDEAAVRRQEMAQSYWNDAAKLEHERSILATEFAYEQVERDRSLFQQRLLEELAHSQRVTQAELALQFAHDDCIAHSVDPAKPEVLASDRLQIYHSLSRGIGSADGANLSALRRMHAAFGGVLRWMAILNFETQMDDHGNVEHRNADDWLRLLVSEAEFCVSHAECKMQGDRILSWTKIIDKEFETNGRSYAEFDVRMKTLKMSDSRVTNGRERSSPECLSLMYGRCTSGVSSFEQVEQRQWTDARWNGFANSVVAAFDIAVGNDLRLRKDSSLVIFPEGAVEKAYIASGRIVVLVRDGNPVNTDHLNFQVVPSTACQVYLNGPSVTGAFDFGRQQSVKSGSIEQIKQELKAEVFPWEDPIRFSGHRSIWSVYLTDNRLRSDMKEEDRKQILDEYKDLQVQVVFPVLYLKQ